MKTSILTIEGRDLRAALEPAKLVSGPNIISILVSALLSADGGRLTVTVTDMVVWATRSVPASGSLAACCIPARELAAIAKESGDDTVEISVSGSKATVRFGRTRYTQPVLPPDNFPSIPSSFKPSGSFSISAADLARLIKTAAPFVDRERNYISGVFLHGDAGDLVAVATDGHRIVIGRCPVISGAPPERSGGILVGEETARAIAALCDAGDAEVSVEFSEHAVRATASAGMVYGKLINATYPDYERIFPDTFAGEIRVSRDDLLRAIRRVLSGVGRMSSFVGLDVSDGSVMVRSDPGEAYAECAIDGDCSYVGAVGFNGKQLESVVGVFPVDSEVFLAGDDPVSPWKITSRDDAGQNVALLMAMRGKGASA